MRPIATDGVARTVGLSVTTVSPKTAEPFEMTSGMWTWVGPRNYIFIGPRSLYGKGHVRGGWSLDFPTRHQAPFSCSGPDVGISLHAVDQRSDWPATEAVECDIKFPNEKSCCDAACRQNSLTTNVTIVFSFLANVNSRSCSLYAVARPSVVCLSSVCLLV